MCFLNFEGAQVMGETGHRTCVMCVQGPHRSVSMKPLTFTEQLACSVVSEPSGGCGCVGVDPFSLPPMVSEERVTLAAGEPRTLVPLWLGLAGKHVCCQIACFK